MLVRGEGVGVREKKVKGLRSTNGPSQSSIEAARGSTAGNLLGARRAPGPPGNHINVPPLCCTPETNTPLNATCIGKRKFLFNFKNNNSVLRAS